MKKKRNILISLALILVVGASVFTYNHYNAVSANESQEKKGKVVVDPELSKDYSTTEDILLRMIKPKIDKVIKNKEGDNLERWRYYKIDSIYFYNDLENDKNDWYKVTTVVELFRKDSEDNDAAGIIIKVDPAEKNGKISDTKVELIEYK
ncbi:hypothetical protein MUO14_17200 [Halobacillus shinanisalinarum]|uniref:Lipoprotein n=1 Tax=Halobacillus shinanisalinarum TaxID=2932258 RepID=A0ABY4GVX3_9BACI|nr:hypothetical protein [Halobacillus shinanisalinarum]UOQ92209.1 hypothetical protein MUO14_17200 [Halobacillus shinanisalinarum]